MPFERDSSLGGFLIRFDEDVRTARLQEALERDFEFSDALSAEDWKFNECEVCGLLFATDTVTYWALAQRGPHVATGKTRVHFLHPKKNPVHLSQLEPRLAVELRPYLVRVRGGARGGRVRGAAWSSLKRELATVNPDALAAINELEELRDRLLFRAPVSMAMQERDASGLALDIFDASGDLRRRTLVEWRMSGDGGFASVLDSLRRVHAIEDQLVARDAAFFPESDAIRLTVAGAVFRTKHRVLEVLNVNRTSVERSLGVDLVYINPKFDAWTLLQYKVLDELTNGEEYCRVDDQFCIELARMNRFRAGYEDQGSSSVLASYRLCGDGFYFKFCARNQINRKPGDLLPGLYIPRPYLQSYVDSDLSLGPRGARLIGAKKIIRHMNAHLFAGLVRDGWVGTRGLTSASLHQIVRASLSANHSLVVGIGRPVGVPAALETTVASLGIQTQNNRDRDR